jgi:hypothetical protein
MKICLCVHTARPRMCPRSQVRMPVRARVRCGTESCKLVSSHLPLLFGCFRTSSQLVMDRGRMGFLISNVTFTDVDLGK